ncbi:MAG: TIGR03960 family B12-binding radical SAM protein [Oscillospiraceae bacterium]|jgi:radical SAM family uncharacterized protein|nr:TIGR03960 family B12-binding radical SAM protein [Oscillospiraceae bacterium]
MKLSELKKYILSVKSPAKYLGGEYGSIVKDKSKIDVRFAFCFPDTYEIGMSHLGLRILYGLINERENFWCERAFSPAEDFEQLMRDKAIKLYGLESYDDIKDFDFIGFTLQYELSYTNILNMLDLAGIPIYSKDRTVDDPIVIAGGPCCCNPEPLFDFFDLFVLGEGEEVTLEILDLYNGLKSKGTANLRNVFFDAVSGIEGVYRNNYVGNDVSDARKMCNIHEKIAKKRIISDLNTSFYPKETIVPFNEIVHDRAVEEVIRGCIRGCRFCQAGYIYRPYREKDINTINTQVKSLCDFTGYETVSLSSLSTADYSKIEELLHTLNDYTESNNIGMSLPSMRLDSFSDELISELMKVRKSGLTFAPEAGTQRLRDVINKNISEDEIFKACESAFTYGINSIKLYYMLGLPTETDEDILEIARLSERILSLYYRVTKEKNIPNVKPPHISISASTFIPKPFTPFQFAAQASEEEIRHKQQILKDAVRKNRKLSVSYNDYRMSFLEAILARGDRELSKVIYTAWKNGCKFDGWDDHFKWKIWVDAFAENNINPQNYVLREYEKDHVFPWDHLDFFIDKDFLWSEWEKAKTATPTPNCRESCSSCGLGNLCNIHTI